MATAGSEILSYNPNPLLGLGSNPDIPAIYSDNNVINQTGRDIMLLNHENNIKLYDQKIKDRDKQLELIDKGQIETGRVLDRDKLWLKGLETTADKSFADLVKSKPGTPQYADAYRNYQKNLTAYKDGVTVAQHNQLGVDTLNVEKSKEPLKFKQDRLQEFTDKELKKPAGSSVGVYVPALDYDADAINNMGEGVITGSNGTPSTGTKETTVSTGSINPATGTTEKVSVTNIPGKPSKTVTTKTTAPLSGKQPQAVGEIVYKDGLPYSRTKQYVDFDKILSNKAAQYIDDSGEQHENQNNHIRAYETAPDDVLLPVLQRIVNRAKDYNNDKGLQAGEKGYINPADVSSKLGLDPTTNNFKTDSNGKPVRQKIRMLAPEFAALTALANYSGSYAPATDVLLKDQAELGLKKGLNDANIWYKYAMGNAANKKANAYASHLAAKVKALKSTEEQENFLDEIYNRNLTEQPSLIKGLKGNSVMYADIDAQKSLPVFTFDGANPKQLKPIGATDVKDNSGHIIGYKGGHFKQQYIVNGKSVNANKLSDMYIDFKNSNKELGIEWNGSFDDYLKESIKHGFFDVKLVGENGSTDRKLSRAAQMVISNKATKKDQEGVFEPPADEQSQQE